MMTMRVTVQMVNHLDMRFVPVFCRLLGIRLEVIDATQIIERVKQECGIGLNELRDLGNCGGSNLDPGVNRFEGRAGNFVAEFRNQLLMDVCYLHATRRKELGTTRNTTAAPELRRPAPACDPSQQPQKLSARRDPDGPYPA